MLAVGAYKYQVIWTKNDNIYLYSKCISFAMTSRSIEELEKSSRVLDQTRRLALETEDIAASTLADLRNQRNRIQSTKQKVGQIESNLSESNKTLNNMNNSCSIS